MQNNLEISVRAMKFVVSDIDGMTAFYCDTFGFELKNEIQSGDITEKALRLPGSELGLVLIRHGDEPITAGTSHGPLVLETNDVKALVDAVVAAGGTLTTGPVELPRELPRVTVAMVEDPEGHALEILHWRNDR